MRNQNTTFKLGAGIAAFAMVFSSAAHAAPTNVGNVDPLVSLSVFGTSASRAAICAAGTAAAGAAATAAATAAQPSPGPGCVLPVLGAAPPPPVVQAVPPAVPVATGSGIGLGGVGGLLPLFAILGLTALAVAYLENKKDEGPPPLSPV